MEVPVDTSKPVEAAKPGSVTLPPLSAGPHQRRLDRIAGVATFGGLLFGYDTEVFSPGFAVHGRAREASLQVKAVSRPSAECLLAGACSEGPRWKSLTTRCRPGQRR